MGNDHLVLLAQTHFCAVLWDCRMGMVNIFFGLGDD